MALALLAAPHQTFAQSFGVSFQGVGSVRAESHSGSHVIGIIEEFCSTEPQCSLDIPYAERFGIGALRSGLYGNSSMTTSASGYGIQGSITASALFDRAESWNANQGYSVTAGHRIFAAVPFGFPVSIRLSAQMASEVTGVTAGVFNLFLRSARKPELGVYSSGAIDTCYTVNAGNPSFEGAGGVRYFYVDQIGGGGTAGLVGMGGQPQFAFFSGSYSAAVVEDCSAIPPPLVSLDIEGPLLMREIYKVGAFVANPATVPVRVRLNWAEIYASSPRPTQPPRQGTVEDVLSPGGGRTIWSQDFFHTWPWLDSNNPVVPLRTALTNFTEAAAWEYLEQRVSLISFSFSEYVSLLEELMERLSAPSDPSASVRYTVTVQYDRAEAGGLSLSGTPVTRLVTLTVPAFKQNELLAYTTDAAFASAFINAGTSALFTGAIGIGIAGTSFASAAYLLDMARVHYDNAVDPPDYEFTEIAVPAAVELSGLDDRATGPWGELATTMKAKQALVVAEAISRNRADGAALSNDFEWESRQLSAAAGFAAEQLKISGRVSGLLSQIIPYVRANYPPPSVDSTVSSGGLPGTLVDFLVQRGWTESDIGAISDAMAATGSWSLDDPSRLMTLLKLSALQAGLSSSEAHRRSTELRVRNLGSLVIPLTSDEEAQLLQAKALVDVELARNVPSASASRAIADYYGLSSDLLARTNNYPALEAHLSASLDGWITFQSIPGGIDGILEFLEAGVNAGEVSKPDLIHSLRVKMDHARQRILQAKFEPAKGAIKSFMNEVRAQRGKGISLQLADDLINYAAHVHELLGT